MTNTLHRYGGAETLEDDFIVFAMASRGLNDQNSTEKFRRFLEIATRHGPINLGDATRGGLYRPTKCLNPLAHWFRKDERDQAALVRAIEGPTVASAVFDNSNAVVAFLQEVKEADLGLSVNVSSLTDRADELARKAGITRHSVEFSLGFFGALDKLPDRWVLQLSTMCGHGMISFDFATKMMDWVKAGRRTPEDASRYMARFCTCGVFNTTRAARILRTCAHRK
jgi:hypothetical protein